MRVDILSRDWESAHIMSDRRTSPNLTKRMLQKFTDSHLNHTVYEQNCTHWFAYIWYVQ